MPLLVLTLLGALLRFLLIGHQGLWLDESYTSYLVHLPAGKMLGAIPETESSPPLYYMVAWVWVRIFGFGAAGLRTLSAACGTLTIPAVFVAARKLLASGRAALIAAALTAFNPLLIWYSQEARAYSLLVLTSTLVLIGFAYAREQPSGRRLALWTVGAILALLTHYYAVLVIAPTGAWLLWEHRRRVAAWLAVAAVAIVGCALLPLLIRQTATGNQRWIGQMPLLFRIRELPALALIGPEAPLRDVLKYLAFAVVLAGLALLATRASSEERRGTRTVAILIAAGLALSAVAGAVNDTFLARNLLGLWPAAAMLLASGLGVAGARRTGVALVMGLCLIGVVAVVGVDASYNFQRPNWGDLAAVLGPVPAAARLILVQHNPAAHPLAVYLHGLRYVRGHAVRGVSEIVVVAAHSHTTGRYCWWGSACNLVPTELQRSYSIPGFKPLGPILHIKQFSIDRLVAKQPVTVTVREIRHALQRRNRLSFDTLVVQRGDLSRSILQGRHV